MLIKNKHLKKGFTIVELLIVIVVIAILAAIAIVSYNSITQRTVESSLKTDLRTSSKKLLIKKQEDGAYPNILPAELQNANDTTTLAYQSDGLTFCLSATSVKYPSMKYFITDTGALENGDCAATAKQLEAGGRHNIILGSNGEVYTWGNNSSGQLGNNNALQRTPKSISAFGSLVGKKATQVSSASDASYALTSDGVVHAWGFNTSYQLGDGTNTSKTVPTSIGSSGSLNGKTITAIASGGMHALALASDGTIHAWGYNGWGSVGNGTATTPTVPVNITNSGSLSGKSVEKVFATNNTSFALTSDGSLHAWGGNSKGELGNGSAVSQVNSPIQIASSGSIAGKTIKAISAGSTSSHVIALANDGTIHAWGSNLYGTLGNNSSTDSRVPINISSYGSLSGKTVVAIGTGENHSLATTSDGIVHAWGRGSSNQLGNNTTTNSSVPIAVSSYGSLPDASIVSVRAGFEHSIGIAANGKIHTWGNNGQGQIGDNSLILRPVAVLISLP